MKHFLLGKIALACLGFSLSICSFSQESASINSELQVQKQKLETEQKAMSAAHADMQTEQAKLNAELAQSQSNLNRLTITGYKKVDPKDLKSKEISAEFTAAKNAEIYIENSNRNIDIKVWDQPKVKIITTIQYDGDASKVTDAEWFEKINISFRNTANSIKIKTGSSGNNFYRIDGNAISWGGANVEIAGTGVFPQQGKTKKTLTIYVPKDNNLDIESKYAEVLVDGNLNKLNADITNGGLELGDVNKLFLRSKYSNVNVGNIKSAEVELINGRFIAKDADDLDLDTKYATIEAGSVKKLMVRSTNDEYEMEEVGSITCRKNYGNLRITKLNTSFDFDGTNADIKIRNIGSSLESIKINNKYADIRLPMRNVKNYEVAYLGSYSTIYAGFEKIPVKDKEEEKIAETNKKINTQLQSINRSAGTYAFAEREISPDGHFTAKVGDGKGAKLDLKCQNCTVDFK